MKSSEAKRNDVAFRFVWIRFVSFGFVSISFRTLKVPYFISYKHNCIEQKRKYVIFLDIGGILEKGVHESSACDTGVYRLPNFHNFKLFPFQSPYNLDHVFNSQLHLTIPFCLFNSITLQYLSHVTHFSKSLPLSHFPQTVPTLPFIRPFLRLRRHILHQPLFLIQPMA
jgi:hypothetical protein